MASASAASGLGPPDFADFSDLPNLPRWWVPVVVGTLGVIAGILALVWPEPTLLLVGITFGVYMLFAGAGNLVSAFTNGSQSTFLRVLESILGLFAVLAGSILIVRPAASVVVVAFVLGFWFLVTGTMQLATGFAFRDGRWFNLIVGAIGLIAGIAILAQPRIGVVTLVWIVSFALLGRGMVAIVLGFGIRATEKANATSGSRA